MNTLHLDPKFTDERRRQRLFAGDFCLYSAQPSVVALCTHASQLIHQAFVGKAPETAQYEMQVEEFVSIIGPLKTLFTNDAKTKALVREILKDFGHDLRQTYFDVPRLRVVTSDKFLTAGLGYAYKAHRDTWYSSPDGQINWWLPVFDLETDRTLAIYPEYWNRPIKNSSSGFDYDEWTRVGRSNATSQVKTDTRNHPLPTEAVDAENEMRLVLLSGQPVLFSGAHLHATVPNNSGKTRFSIDFRTIHLDDIPAGHGAPNIDNQCRGTTMGDFLSADDFSPIAREWVDQARAVRNARIH